MICARATGRLKTALRRHGPRTTHRGRRTGGAVGVRNHPLRGSRDRLDPVTSDSRVCGTGIYAAARVRPY